MRQRHPFPVRYTHLNPPRSWERMYSNASTSRSEDKNTLITTSAKKVAIPSLLQQALLWLVKHFRVHISEKCCTWKSATSALNLRKGFIHRSICPIRDRERLFRYCRTIKRPSDWSRLYSLAIIVACYPNWKIPPRRNSSDRKQHLKFGGRKKVK